MIAEAVLVVIRFIGLAISRGRNVVERTLEAEVKAKGK